MEEAILRFGQALRRAGIRITVSELQDALRAVNEFGLEDSHRFQCLLRAVFVKDRSDNIIFDRAFRLFFLKKDPKPDFAEISTQNRCDGDNGDGPKSTGGPKGTGGMNQMAKEFYQALTQKDGAALWELTEQALDTAEELTDSELSIDEQLEQLKIALSWYMVSYAAEVNQDQSAVKTMEEMERYLRHSLERKAALASEEGFDCLMKQANLKTCDLAALSEGQVKEMERRIEKLGRHLASRYSYRFRPAKYGIPDMRRIMAETAKRGTPPMPLPRLNKEKNRPSLVVLCDISGSMSVYSTFLMELVYAMHKRFRDLRSFLFIDGVVEADTSLRKGSVSEAVKAAITKAYAPRTGRTEGHCTTTGLSDYGKAFETFSKNFGHVLTEQTTLIIMGDGRSNWFPPKKEELAAIAQKVKRVFWLNPEPRERWNTEDSVIGLYAPFCDGVYQCQNLEQLTDAVRHIT